ncbi:helicase c2 [gamma proteobacterium HTCC5015]|nr:helicase c2 [gamma proteobacterium HTCC5015]
MSASDLLGAEGPLAKVIEGYAPRDAQQQMAEAVEKAIEDIDVLVVEAGTGVGKTYAYLIPAILSGQKVIISTGTRTLQDQLYHRDLPMLLKTLGVPLKRALLKGRSNYLCLHRMGIADVHHRDREQSEQLAEIKRWSRETIHGDMAEVTLLPENAPILPKVTSTADNCLGVDCEFYNDCHVVKARREAQEADLVVVNHHLFMADMALKQDGFGEVLPTANAFIFDEAHQLPEVASLFFGQAVGSRQLLEFVKDIRAVYHTEISEADSLIDLSSRLEMSVRDFRLSLGAKEQRQAWQPLLSQADVRHRFADLAAAMSTLRAELVEWEEQGPGVENLLKRCTEFEQRLTLFDHLDEDYIYWLETTRLGFVLNMTPLSVAKTFRAHMSRYEASWVFTSATLAVGEQFHHFTQSLGLWEPRTLRLESPFDYANNSIICLPENLPEPSAFHFTDAVVDAAKPILQASRGRAFMLFTSYRALNHAAERLKSEVAFPLFVQGEAPRTQLLDDFRESGDGVLLGTSSFWEGVDIKGEALSCVIIDKLPFAAPNDPVLQARMDAMKEQGQNPFMDYQLPNAVIALKQGVGRLIRDVHDRGVVVICDVRLKTKFYGKRFTNSLPPMKRTRKLSDIQQFFAK